MKTGYRVEQKTFRGWMGLAIVFLALVFAGCTERVRNNPFEPGEDDQLVALTLQPEDDAVMLSWTLIREVSNISGFRVYRAVGSADNWQQLAVPDAGERSFRDQQVQQGVNYFYRVTVLGTGLESKPSNVESTFLGPGQWWVLTSDDRNLKLLSYDLKHINRDYRSEFLSENWAVPEGNDSLFWLSTPSYVRSVVSLNRFNGNERFFYFDSLSRATDLTYNTAERRLFVLDNNRKRMFVIAGNNISRIVRLNADHTYFRIAMNASQSQVWLLSNEVITVYRIELGVPQLLGTRDFSAGFTGKDIRLYGDFAYVISAAAGSSELWTLNESGDVVQSLTLAGNYYRVRKNDDNTFLLAQSIAGGNDALVKIDAGGAVLFRQPLFGFIEDIAVNPVNSTIVVADYEQSLVRLFDADGNPLSESRYSNGNRVVTQPLRLYFD